MSDSPKWTAKPPTEPGLYWYALLNSNGITRYCKIFEKDGEMHVFTDGGPALAGRMHRVWAGPLREPTGEATHGA